MAIDAELRLMATVRYMVTDVDRAADFYVDRLGFERGLDMSPAFVQVKRGDLTLWLAGPTSSAARAMPDGRAPVPGGWNRLVLDVDDVVAMAQELSAAGVSLRNEVVSGPGGKQVLVDDPDGNPVELFEARHG